MLLTIPHKMRVPMVWLVARLFEVDLRCWHYNKILKATPPIWILTRQPVILFTFGLFASSWFELRLLLLYTICCDHSSTNICSWLMIWGVRIFNKVSHNCVWRLILGVYNTIVTTTCLSRFNLTISRAIRSCWSCAQLLFDCVGCRGLSV